MARKKKEPKNLLDLVPERCLECERDDDGRVHLLEPKFSGPLLGKLLQPRMRQPYTKTRLDEVGTQVWDHCDGSTDVRTISVQLAEHFGPEFDPEHKRLALFMHALSSRGWIRYRKEG